MVAILATVNEADNVTLVRAEGGVLPVFPLPITAAGVVSVGATAPITSTGGPTPVIGINPAVAGVSAGSLSAADKAKLDGIAPGAAVNSITGANGIAIGGTATVPMVSWVGGISVANGAALTALSTTAFVTGALAYVQTYGALWSYQPASVLAPDGSTVLAAAGGGNWLRGPSLITEAALVQTAWFVDPSAGSDENTGLTSGTALKSKAEIARRWGTWSPVLNGVAVLVTYVTADTTGNDPGLFTPFFVNGARLRHFAALPAAAFTGTLNVVTAKNVAGNQTLTASFNTTTGAIAANMILVNATRANSRSIAVVNLGGGVWSLDQPLAVTNPAAFINPTNVDTWVSGDAISGFVPINVDFALIGGQTMEGAAGAAPSHVVQQITIFDPSGNGNENVICNQNAPFLLLDSVVSRNFTCQGTTNFVFSHAVGCAFVGFAMAVDSPTSLLGIAGGHIATNLTANLVGCGFSNNVGIFGIVTLGQSFTGAGVGKLFVATGQTVTFIEDFRMGAGDAFYGQGVLNQQAGTMTFSGTAVAAFPLAGGLQLNGVATGYSNLTTAGLVAVHKLTLNPTNLDAAAGAAGFGGFAWGGGAAFSKAGAQP